MVGFRQNAGADVWTVFTMTKGGAKQLGRRRVVRRVWALAL